MRERRTYGSERGARGNSRPYRDMIFAAVHESAVGIVSRVTPAHTAVHNRTRDERSPFEVGNQVLISSHRHCLAWSCSSFRLGREACAAAAIGAAKSCELSGGLRSWGVAEIKPGHSRMTHCGPWPHPQQAGERTYALLPVGCEATLLARPLATAPESSSHEVFEVRARESHRGEVLRGVRRTSGPRMPELREPSFEHGKVLS
jgi:hypothetical protein